MDTVEKLTDENTRLLAAYNSLMKKVVDWERHNRPACEHFVLGPRYLPCPHPSCFAGLPGVGDTVRFLRYSRTDIALKPLLLNINTYRPATDIEAWERYEERICGEKIWAWRRMSHIR